MRLVCVLVVVAGCGRIGFAPLTAERADGAAGDSTGWADAPPPCASWNAFSAPTTVPIAGNVAHYMGSVTDDGRMIVFTNYNNATFDDLYVATRASPADAFSGEMLLSEIQTVDNDYNPSTRDGLTLFFAREVNAAPPEVMMTTRATIADMFGPPVAVMELDSTGYDSPGWLSSDGLRIYIASDRAGDADIYMASRTSTTATFGAPTILTELAATGLDTHPALSSDELEIFWSSKRASARFDIYRATRTNRTDPFGAPMPVTELNTTANDDCYPSLSPDGTTIYFNYNMLTSGGAAPVSTATRTCASN